MSPESRSVTPIVLIGAGVIGKKHAGAVADNADVTLAAIVDPTPAGKCLAEHADAPAFSSITDFLSSGIEAKGAIICTPNDTHVPLAMQLASAGLHILVEKPLSSDPTEGEKLITQCSKNGVKLCVGHHRRQNPRVAAAKGAIETGVIGDVIGCSGDWVTMKTQDYFEGAGSWRRDGGNGGVVLINVIHEIDTLQFLIGRIVRVYAEKAPNTRGFAAEEGVALTLRFKTGAVGTFMALDSACSPFTFEQATGEFPYHPYTGEDTYRVFGKKGTLAVPQNELWLLEDLSLGWKSPLRKSIIPWNHGYAFQRQLQNFVDVIKGKAEPSCSGEDGLAAVRVCRAIQTSLSEGRPVDI